MDRVLLSFDGSSGDLRGAVRLLGAGGEPARIELLPEHFSRGKYWYGRQQYGYGAVDLQSMEVSIGRQYLQAQDVRDRLEKFTGELPAPE